MGKGKMKVIVLGGGLSGLVAADRLLNNGFEVKILEGANFLGGLASSFRKNGEEIPRFNHHIVRSNSKTIEYLERYALLGKNSWTRIRMGIGVNGKIHNINSPLGLLGFNYLSLWGKIRFGLFGLYAILLMNPEKIKSNLDLDTWLSRHAGKEVKEKIWMQMYGRNKFNIPLSQISAKQFAHRLHEKEGYDLFTYPEHGIQGLIDGLEKDINEKSGEIMFPVKIKGIDIKEKQITYYDAREEVHSEKFDILVNTIPVPELIKFTAGLPQAYVSKIRKLRYVPVIGLALATEDFLDKKIYWINLFQERIHVIYQHSVIFDRYRNKITWCVRYGGSEEDFGKSDEEIKKLYIPVLKKYFPDMKLKWCLVFRDKYAEPVYDKNYSKYAPTYETPLDYFFNAGIQVTFPKIRNMHVALESGEIVADKITEKFNKEEKRGRNGRGRR